MGNLWLPDVDDWIRAGPDVPGVEVWPGWLTRSRSSGGFADLYAITLHHDASSPSSDWRAVCRDLWETNAVRPVGNAYLRRDGVWVVGAAGASNTNGKGGPLRCSRGTIPLDQGNQYAFAVEADNSGVGEVWPDVQLRSYVGGIAGVIAGLRDVGAYDAALGVARRLVLNPVGMDVHAHFEWTDRKIDPAGPPLSPAGYGNPADSIHRWKMGELRSDVAAALDSPEPPPPGDPVYRPQFIDYSSGFERMWDSRPAEPAWHNPALPKGPLAANTEVRVAVAFGHVAQVRVHALGAAGPGYVSVSGIAGDVSPLINLRPAGDGSWAGDGVATLYVPEGVIYVNSPQQSLNVVIDVCAVGA